MSSTFSIVMVAGAEALVEDQAEIRLRDGPSYNKAYYPCDIKEMMIVIHIYGGAYTHICGGAHICMHAL